MAFRTVAGAVDQIGAAVPFLVLRGIGRIGRQRNFHGVQCRTAFRDENVVGSQVSVLASAAPGADDDQIHVAAVSELEGLGLGEGALARVAHGAYHLLGRRTFLTTGDKESRAWTFRAGARAPECAGVIHSDLQRGFIRAEVIRWDELLELGSWQKAKDVGRLRVEGKDYEVADGDVLEIRFNV